MPFCIISRHTPFNPRPHRLRRELKFPPLPPAHVEMTTINLQNFFLDNNQLIDYNNAYKDGSLRDLICEHAGRFGHNLGDKKINITNFVTHFWKLAMKSPELSFNELYGYTWSWKLTKDVEMGRVVKREKYRYDDDDDCVMGGGVGGQLLLEM